MCIGPDFRICLFLLHLHLIKVLPHTLALLPPSSVYAQPPRSDSHILWNKKLRSIFDPRTHIGHKPARIVLGHPGNSFTFDKGCHFCFEIDIIHGWFMVFLLDPIFSTPEVSESQTFTRWVPLLLCPWLFFFLPANVPVSSLFSLLLTFFCCMIWLFTPPILGKTSRGEMTWMRWSCVAHFRLSLLSSVHRSTH